MSNLFGVHAANPARAGRNDGCRKSSLDASQHEYCEGVEVVGASCDSANLLVIIMIIMMVMAGAALR